MPHPMIRLSSLKAAFQILEKGVFKSNRQSLKERILWQRGEVDLGIKLEYKLLELQVFEEGVPCGK
jgi:hypothetical protein